MSGPAKAQNLRQHSTDAEQALWKHLRNRQLAGYKFRRQVPVGKYIVDFVRFERKLAIEVDGGHHQEQVPLTLPGPLGWNRKAFECSDSGITKS